MRRLTEPIDPRNLRMRSTLSSFNPAVLRHESFAQLRQRARIAPDLVTLTRGHDKPGDAVFHQTPATSGYDDVLSIEHEHLTRTGAPRMRVGWAPRPLAGSLGLLALGSLRPELVRGRFCRRVRSAEGCVGARSHRAVSPFVNKLAHTLPRCPPKTEAKMRVIIPTLVGLVAFADHLSAGSPGSDKRAPSREMARKPSAERPQEPAVRLSCRYERQLPCLPDEKRMRADQRRRVARKLRRLIQ